MPTVTPSTSSSPTLSPSRTATSPATPSATPTPSTTAPPFSCLTRPEGCATPFLPVSAPTLFSGPALPPLLSPPTSLYISYGLLTASATLTLPVAPSAGESAAITCAPSSPSSAALSWGSPLPPLGACADAPAPPVGALCGTLAPPYGSPPLLFPLLASAPAPAPAASSGTLQCTVRSTPLFAAVTDPALLPRYGAFTALIAPLVVLPGAAPLLAAVLAESNVTQGSFRALGGGGGGAGPYALPGFTPACAAAPAPNASLPWAAPELAACAPAMAAAEALAVAAAAGAPSGATSFSATLSGRTTLLLLAPRGAPFPANLTVSLGGLPCAVAWASPNRSAAAVVTPPLAALCAAAGPAAGDCGVATLLLSDGAPLTAEALAGALGAPGGPPPELPLPGAYPPLAPGGSPLRAALLSPALAALPDGAALLALAAALSAPADGIRVVAACTDASFAAPEACSVDGGGAQRGLPAGLFCAWGSGDACQRCPPGAVCPGGAVLLPRPGFWAPSALAPPSELEGCAAPAPTQRCPGYFAAQPAPGGDAAAACGEGYAGVACAACAPRFWASAGACAPCPTVSTSAALLLPVLQFIGGILALGLLLALLLFASLKLREARVRAVGGAGAEKATLVGTLPSVAQLMLWVWIAAQGSAALFGQAQALAPAALAPLYGALAALQFKGITVGPECFSSIPFASLYGAAAYVCACGVVLFLCARAAPPPAPPPPAQPPLLARARALLLQLALTALLVGYGAVTSVLANTLTCRPAAPMAVFDYVQALSDGRALGEALGGGGVPAPLSALRAAAADPRSPRNAALAAWARATSIPVSVLASDPFQVCREGPHLAAWWLALVFCILFTLGLPALGFVVLWRAGRLKGLRRWLLRLRSRRRSGLVGGGGDARAPPPAAATGVLARIHGAMDNSTLRKEYAWVAFFDQLVLATYTGLVALSARTTGTPDFVGVNACVVLVAAAYMGALTRAQPFTPQHAWKRVATGGLHGLTALTAVFSAAVRGGAAAAAGLGNVPLAYALGLLLLMVGAWWMNGFRYGVPVPATGVKHPPQPPTHAGDAPATVVNPLRAAPAAPAAAAPAEAHAVAVAPAPENNEGAGEGGTIHPPPPPPPPRGELEARWRREKADDGDAFWFLPPTGESAWELPAGARTECGWAHDEAAGLWLHGTLGVTRAEPPPLDAAALPPPPAAAAPQARASAKWRRVEHEDGDFFWHHPPTETSAYELPQGAATECGWRHRAAKGVWAHKPSGATSPCPPPADVGAAEAIIAAHRAAVVAAAAVGGAAAAAGAAEAASAAAAAPAAPTKGAQSSAVTALLERRTPRAAAASGRHRWSGGGGGGGGSGATGLSQRGAARVLSKAEVLAATRSKVVKARVARAFEGGPMTPFFAAMLVQLRWRQLRANRTKRLWKNVAALDGGGGKLQAAGSHQADVELHSGWTQRSSRITGELYYFHKESGRSQWEKPAPK
jgi:hypothetical protein